jgi:phage head maturation protease
MPIGRASSARRSTTGAGCWRPSNSRTLRLTLSEAGLRFEADLPPTRVGEDVLTLVRRGDLAGVSIGFALEKDSWQALPSGRVLRTLESIEVREVSIVDLPAYPDTYVELQARSRVLFDALIHPSTIHRDRLALLRARLHVGD